MMCSVVLVVKSHQTKNINLWDFKLSLNIVSVTFMILKDNFYRNSLFIIKFFVVNSFLFLSDMINHSGNVPCSREAATVTKKWRKRREDRNNEVSGGYSLVDVRPIDKRYVFTDWALIIAMTKMKKLEPAKTDLVVASLIYSTAHAGILPNYRACFYSFLCK